MAIDLTGCSSKCCSWNGYSLRAVVLRVVVLRVIVLTRSSFNGYSYAGL